MWSREGSFSRWMSPSGSQTSLPYYARPPWDPATLSRNNSASTFSCGGSDPTLASSVEGATTGNRSRKSTLLSPARSILKTVRRLSGRSGGGGVTSRGKATQRQSSGQVNMKAVSLMLAAVCVVLLASMAIASASKDTIEEATVEVALAVLYSISALWIFVTLVLGWTKKLTVDPRYLHRKNNRLSFQKIGAAIFGTGAMLYNALRIAEFVAKDAACRTVEYVVVSVMSILFTSLQVYLILIYAKVTINKGRLVPVLSRFGLMLVLATNIAVWIITTISEAKHTMEVELKKSSVNYDNPPVHYTYTTPHLYNDSSTISYHNSSTGNANHSSHDSSCDHSGASYQSTFASYLYPCVIEYSLISATTVFLIWSKVKIQNRRKFGLHQRQDVPRSVSFYGNRGNFKKSSSLAKMEHQRKCFSIVLPQIQEESFSDESTGNCENPKESSTDPETGAGSIPRPKSLPLIKNLNENPEPESPLATTEKVHFNIGSSELGPEAGHPARGYDIQGGVHTPEEPVSNGSAFVGFNRNKHVSSIRSVASERSIATTVFEPNWSEEREHTYVNNHCGLFVGMLVILASVAVIIVFLYLMYNGKSPDLANSHLFGTKIFINALSILVTIATHIQIKGLMKKTDNLKEMGRLGRDPRRHVPSRGQQHQQSMDKALLGIATLGLLTYCMLTIIAGLSTAGMEAALTTADAFCTSTQAIIQSLFLVTSFLPRRATLREHREKRPGRQGLVFLLCCNFCLWALNSFGLRNEIANHVQIEFYSFKTWIILSHVSLPLLILFRFHSLVCIADVISHAYTAKYIGLESHGT